jgi:hypothetical protein
MLLQLNHSDRSQFNLSGYSSEYDDRECHADTASSSLLNGKKVE